MKELEMTKKQKKFKKKHGFYEHESYGLDIHLIEWLLPRLKHFRKNLNGYPSGLSEKKWDKVLKQIEEGLTIHITDNYWYLENDEKDIKRDTKKVLKASRLLGKHLYDLWD